MSDSRGSAEDRQLVAELQGDATAAQNEAADSLMETVSDTLAPGVGRIVKNAAGEVFEEAGEQAAKQAEKNAVESAAGDAEKLLSNGSCSGVFCNGERIPDTGQNVDVELNYSRNQTHHDPEEFVDQAFDQGEGLSERTAGDALDTIKDYAENGRPSEAQTAIGNYRNANPDVDTSGKDILHKTDICAGGDPSCISRAGDSGVNRSIGNQNGRQAGTIKEQLEQVDSDVTPTVRVNIENKAGD